MTEQTAERHKGGGHPIIEETVAPSLAQATDLFKATPPPPPRQQISFTIDEAEEAGHGDALSPDSVVHPLHRLGANDLGSALLRTANSSRLDDALQRAAHAAREELREFASSKAPDPKSSGQRSAVLLATVLVFRWPIQLVLHCYYLPRYCW